MKNLFLAVLSSLLLISSIVYSQSGWYQVTSPQTGYDFRGVYFADVNTGIVDKWKTTNGGTNWTQTSTVTGYAIYFLNPGMGYRSGTNYIARTTDIGSTWQSYIVPSGTYTAVYFVDINTGYMAGDANKVIKTTDGGTGGVSSWAILDPGVSGYAFRDMYFLDANTGFICGLLSDYTSMIIKTTNGGLNWTSYYFPFTSTIWTLTFINSNTGFAAGKKIFKTTNAGINWIEKASPVPGVNGFYCFSFKSPNTGYLAGAFGVIIKTINGGETWYQQNSGFTVPDFNDIYFINDNTGYVCNTAGNVVKTTDGGGPVGIQPISTNIPVNYGLEQNYPNPFNPETKIKFLIPKENNVKLTVYDVLGNEVSVLVNENLRAGEYEVSWSATGGATQFSSGVYFYKLITSDYTMTKRMVLIK